MRKMREEGYSAACFRIVPNDKNLLGRLQKLDYSIFTDALRKLLGVPVCLIGQGVLWKNLLLMDFVAQPFKLMAVPLLLSVILFRIAGRNYEIMGGVYRQSFAASFRYGSFAIISIWLLTVVNSCCGSFICIAQPPPKLRVDAVRR